MDLVDKFLATVTDEYGNKIDFSNVESEGFEGSVYFGEEEIDIYIIIDYYHIYNAHYITEEEYAMCEAFKDYVQQKMKEHKAFLQDDINTKNNLYYKR